MTQRRFWVARIADTNGGTTAVLFGMPETALEREIIEEACIFAEDSMAGRCVEVEDLDTFLGNTFMEVVTI